MDPITALIIAQIVIFVLAELLRPKPKIENAKPAALGDFDFPTATEDRVVPLLWGTCKQSGPNVIWYGDYRQEALTKSIRVSLFKKIDQVTGFRYHLGVQFALCRGEIDSLRRIWIGDVPVFSSDSILAATVALAGTGYQRGDVLTLSGGTFTKPARVRVEAITIPGTGVQRVTLIDRGEYEVFPTGASAATTGGSGSGCTISMTKGALVEHGDEVTVDCPDLFGGEELGAGGVVGTLTLFAGTDDQAASPYLSSNEVASATVAAGGTGYSVGDILTVSGGTFTSACQLRVQTLSGSSVATVAVVDPGFYTAFPSGAASTTVAPSGGSGCTVTLANAAGFQSVSNVTPRYLRTAYLAPSVDPIYLGNSTSIKPWAFEITRIPNPLGLGDPTVNTYDANPANCIVEVITDAEWGLRRPASEIGTSFSSAAATLRTEGNGFSMILDRRVEAQDLLRILEEQVKGSVYFDQAAGKWEIELSRGGYDVDDLLQLTVSNVSKLESFARGSWAETTNQLSVKFVDRDDDYKSTSALAQDQANINVLQGRVVPSEVDYPGVKSRTLANAIAWRELRTLSYPLAKAVVIVNREAFGAHPGQAVALTWTVGREDLVKFPMRVAEVDLGELEDGRIRLTLAEDIFRTTAGAFSDPGDTSWEPPQDDLQPFLYQAASEAPRGIVLRLPDGLGPDRDLLLAAARRRGPEVGFEIAERHDPSSPSGGFQANGRGYGLALVGRLTSSLGRGSAVPLTSLTISPGPDSQAALEAAIVDASDPVELGTTLLNLIVIRGTAGDEYALVTSAQTSGANVVLSGVYRGVLGTVQGSHAAGTQVWILSGALVVSDSTIPAGDLVDVRLVPFSVSDRLPDAEATTIALQMSNLVRRPYPPSRISLDGTAWASSTSLEANGSGPEDYALDVSDVRRRDYRTVDEATALTADASTLFSDFPAAGTTTHKIDVRDDPAGANTLLLTTADFSGTQKDVRRIEILKANGGAIPATLRLDVWATHLHESVSYDSAVPLRHDLAVTSALSGQFELGALDNGDVSALYTADAAGTHGFTLSSAFTAGNVEYRLNGGSWTVLITAGLTTGSILGVVVSDTIEVRHLSTDVGALKQLDMAAPGVGTDAFGILFT